MNALSDFLKKYPGAKISATFQIEPKEPSAAIKSYYFRSVLYDVQAGFLEQGSPMSLEEVDKQLREASEFTKEETIHGEKILTRTKEIRELSDLEMYWFMFDVQRFAANVNITIKEPFCFTKKIQTNGQNIIKNQCSR